MNVNPEYFLTDKADRLFADWNDQSVSKSRLLALLERKLALGIALEKWTRAGVWVLSRGDSGFPKTWKEKLKSTSPIVIYGIGSPELLSERYVAVVGSRDSGVDELTLASSIGSIVSNQGIGIVSGGARGVDETAMLGTLKSGGFSVGILTDSLIKKSTSSLYRNYIQDNKLLLILSYYPEAGFNAGNAMNRNKLIYAMADFAIVVKSDTSGGTWEGAKENLKHHWAPLWVCKSSSKGNQDIVRLGAQWLPEGKPLNIKELSSDSVGRKENGLFPGI